MHVSPRDLARGMYRVRDFTPNDPADFDSPLDINPTTTTMVDTASSYSHAVSRSLELMSCAKTALKVAKNRQEPWADQWTPQSLHLHDATTAVASEDSDAFVLLRSMRSTLAKLETLVKRRGHTNDPTAEIESAVATMEHDRAALAVHLQTTSMGRNAQHRHHRKVVQQWFQGSSGELQEQLQKVMKHRAEVLAEQTQRRKKFLTAGGAKQTKATFQPPPPPPPKPTVVPTMPKPVPNGTTAQGNGTPPPPAQPLHHSSPATSLPPNGSVPTRTSKLPPPAAPRASHPAIPTPNQPQQPQAPTPEASSSTSSNNPYAYSSPNLYSTTSGYGGGGGMRQRRGQQQQQQQVLLDRQTAQRVQEAQQAEESIAALGTVYGRMSHIVATQGEQLGRIEDDVEAAHTYVTAAQTEIGVLYEIRKGNRPLILKTFALLIFLIVFLRLYAR